MMVNLLALWTLGVVISIQYSYCLTNFHENRKIRSSHKIIPEIIQLEKDTESTILNCSTIINGTKAKVYWTKDGKLIPIGRPLDYYPACKYDANYSCFTNISKDSNSKIKVTLKKFVVKLSEKAKQDNSVCGTAGEDLVQENKICFVPTIYSREYRCCNHHIPPPGSLQLKKTISSEFKSKCKLFTPELPSPWEINVRWNLSLNSEWLWGWQVSLTGLDNDAGVQSCVQINSKDRLLNWTFDRLPFGGKYAIKVQALPSDEKNYIFQKIVLPGEKGFFSDLCEEIGWKCHSEICFHVQNVQQIRMTSVLTWRHAKYHKTQHDFEIHYNSADTNCTDTGTRKVKNTSRVVLNINKCRRYHVKVRPIFSDAREGTFSKPIVFYPPPGQQPSTKPTGTTTESYTNVIVLCSIAIAVLIVVLSAIIFIKRKRKYTSAQLIPVVLDDHVIPNVASIHKTEVFIVHDNHCRLCDNVTHAFAHMLNKTGYVDCILDFCCMNEITERGKSWYVDKIQSCDKIVVVCTKNGKKIYDEKEQREGAYIFILNMLFGQMIHHQNRDLQIVPVYFDISSHEDIPLFLSEYAYYSVPSHVQDLCLALRPRDHPYTDSNIEHLSDEMTHAVVQFKTAVETMRRIHKEYRTSKHKETTM